MAETPLTRMGRDRSRETHGLLLGDFLVVQRTTVLRSCNKAARYAIYSNPFSSRIGSDTEIAQHKSP